MCADKIASLYAEIGVQGLDTVNKGLDGLDSNLKNSKKGFSGLSDATEALALPMAGAAAGIAAVAGAIAITAGATVEYAGQVDDLGRSLGVSAEEASKLIQVADDAKISYEQLSTASKELIKNGIQPSIENIGKLADEYNAIQDPVQKSQFLLEKFGRAGLQMGKLLEQGSVGIKSAADEAERLGLVMSEGDVAAAEKLRLAWDTLGDSATGLKIKIGNELVPALTSALDAVNMMAGGFSGGVSDAIKQHSQDVALSTMSYEEYRAELERVAQSQGAQIDAEGNLVKIRRDGQRTFVDIIQSNYLLSESNREQAQTTAEVSAVLDGYRMSAEDAAAMATALGSAQTTSNDAALGQIDVYGLASAALQTHNIGLATQLDLEEKIALATGAVTQDQLDYKDAVDFLTKQLELGNISQQAYLDMLGKLASGALTAKDAVRQVGDAINALPNSKSISIDINAKYGGAAGEIGIGGDAPVITPPDNSRNTPSSGGFASGGSFVVPGSGSGDRPYRIGLTPGEQVDITPKGQSKGGNTFNIYANSDLDIEMMARRIASIIGAS